MSLRFESLCKILWNDQKKIHSIEPFLSILKKQTTQIYKVATTWNSFKKTHDCSDFESAVE